MKLLHEGGDRRGRIGAHLGVQGSRCAGVRCLSLQRTIDGGAGIHEARIGGEQSAHIEGLRHSVELLRHQSFLSGFEVHIHNVVDAGPCPRELHFRQLVAQELSRDDRNALRLRTDEPVMQDDRAVHGDIVVNRIVHVADDPAVEIGEDAEIERVRAVGVGRFAFPQDSPVGSEETAVPVCIDEEAVTLRLVLAVAVADDVRHILLVPAGLDGQFPASLVLGPYQLAVLLVVGLDDFLGAGVGVVQPYHRPGLLRPHLAHEALGGVGRVHEQDIVVLEPVRKLAGFFLLERDGLIGVDFFQERVV